MLKMDRSLSNKNITTTSAFQLLPQTKTVRGMCGLMKRIRISPQNKHNCRICKGSPAVASWYNDPQLISMTQLQYWLEMCTNAHFISLKKSEICLRFADGQRVSPVPPCSGNSPPTSAALCTARDRMSKLKITLWPRYAYWLSGYARNGIKALGCSVFSPHLVVWTVLL